MASRASGAAPSSIAISASLALARAEPRTAQAREKLAAQISEAAIQSVHAQRAITGFVQTTALRTLYDLLLLHAPSVGVAVSRAAVLLDAGDVETAQAALSALDGEDVAAYQPFWVTRARLAELTGDLTATAAHLERALGLTEDAAVRAFLAERRARLA